MTHKKRIYKYAESTKKKQKEASVRRTIKKQNTRGGGPVGPKPNKRYSAKKRKRLRVNPPAKSVPKNGIIQQLDEIISLYKDTKTYPIVPVKSFKLQNVDNVLIELYNDENKNEYYVIKQFIKQENKYINTIIKTNHNEKIETLLKQFDINPSVNYVALLQKFNNKHKINHKDTCENDITDKLTIDMGFNTVLYNLRFTDVNPKTVEEGIMNKFKSTTNDSTATINITDCDKAKLLVDFITLLIHCIDVRHDFPLSEYYDIVKTIIDNWVNYKKGKSSQLVDEIIGLYRYNFSTIATSFCSEISSVSGTFNAHKGHEKAEKLEIDMIKQLNEWLPGIYLQNPLNAIGEKIIADRNDVVKVQTFVDTNGLKNDASSSKMMLNESGRNIEKIVGSNYSKKCYSFVKNKIDGCSGTCPSISINIDILQNPASYATSNFYTDPAYIIYHKIQKNLEPESRKTYDIYGGLFSVEFYGEKLTNIKTKITNNYDDSFIVFDGVFSVDVIANLISTTPPRGNDRATIGLDIIKTSLGLSELQKKMIALAGKTFGDHSSITENMTVVTTCDGFIKHQAFMETTKRIIKRYCDSNKNSKDIGINILESKHDLNDKYYQYLKFINETDNNDILINNKLRTAYFLTNDCTNTQDSSFDKFLNNIFAKFEHLKNTCINPVQYIIFNSITEKLTNFKMNIVEWKQISAEICDYINNTTYDPTMLSKLLSIPDISYFKNSENENPCLNKIVEDTFDDFDTPFLSEILQPEPTGNFKPNNDYNKYLHNNVIFVTAGNCKIYKEGLLPDADEIPFDEIPSNETYAYININLRDIYYQLTYFLGKHLLLLDTKKRNLTPYEFKVETYLSILKNKLSHLANYETLICAFFKRAFCDAYNLWFKKCLKPVTLDSKKHKPKIIAPLPIAQPSISPSIVSLPITQSSITQASVSQKKRPAEDDLTSYNNNATEDEFSTYINNISNSTITNDTLKKLDITPDELYNIINNCIKTAYDNKDSMDDICNKTFSSLL